MLIILLIFQKTHEAHHFGEKDDLSELARKLQDKGIKETCDIFKYNYSTNPDKYGKLTLFNSLYYLLLDLSQMSLNSFSLKAMLIVPESRVGQLFNILQLLKNQIKVNFFVK